MRDRKRFGSRQRSLSFLSFLPRRERPLLAGNIIGVSETKIISGKNLDFHPNIPGYVFEYAPTPLASGGVGLYINESLKYTIIGKTSNEAF